MSGWTYLLVAGWALTYLGVIALRWLDPVIGEVLVVFGTLHWLAAATEPTRPRQS